MITGHGTKKVLVMTFEILGLVIFTQLSSDFARESSNVNDELSYYLEF